MRGGKGKTLLSDQEKVKLGFPLVLFISSLFFFAGFYVSMLVSQELWDLGQFRRASLMELSESDTVETEREPIVPSGVTGEAKPYTGVPFQILSWMPRAIYFPKFATPEECLGIVKISRPKLSPSTLALRDGETVENTKGIRTSTGSFISNFDDSTGMFDKLEEKIARVTMIPKNQGEDFYILRYQVGQRYASHYDAFSPDEYGPQKSQRMATFLMYLSDVEEGGETMFPYENGSNMDIEYNYFDCIGLTVKPRQGDGLLFYSLLTNGTLDKVHTKRRNRLKQKTMNDVVFVMANSRLTNNQLKKTQKHHFDDIPSDNEWIVADEDDEEDLEIEPPDVEEVAAHIGGGEQDLGIDDGDEDASLDNLDFSLYD